VGGSIEERRSGVIIVTGGAGFIGSAFLWKLNEQGIDDVLVVDRLGTSDKWKNLVHRRCIDFIHKDDFPGLLDDGNRYFRASAIIHMGACSATTERDADYLYANNYRYTRTLAEWCLKRNVFFMYASSAATYGDGARGFSDDPAGMDALTPLNMYAFSKQLFDQWALRNRVLDRMTGIKFFNVYGPNEYHKAHMVSMIYRAFHQIRETGRVRLFKSYLQQYADGGQLRDFVYIKDCVDVMWWLFNNRSASGIYNLGTGTARSWNDLAGAIFAAMGKKTDIEYIEMPEELRDRYQYFTEADMARLRAAGCNHTFMKMEDSVRDYVVNYLARDVRCL